MEAASSAAAPAPNAAASGTPGTLSGTPGNGVTMDPNEIGTLPDWIAAAVWTKSTLMHGTATITNQLTHSKQL